jgi:hypothetical protein
MAMSEWAEQQGDPEVGSAMCVARSSTKLALSQHLIDEHGEDLLPDQPIEK